MLHSEPRPVSEIAGGLPLELHRILGKCLRKERDDRYQHADDLAVDLRSLAIDGASGTAAAEVGASGAEPSRARSLSGVQVAVALLAAAVGTALVVAWALRPADPELPAPARFDIEVPAGQNLARGNRNLLAISPDGQRIAYVADGMLFTRSLGDPEIVPIRGTDGASAPAFSPDGEWIAFVEQPFAVLRKVPTGGGAAVTLASLPSGDTGMRWQDDFIYVAQDRQGVVRVPDVGGEFETVVEVEPGFRASRPQLLPGGEWILFTHSSAGGLEENVVAQSLETGERRILVAGAAEAEYLASGHLVYVQGQVLYGVAFDVERLEIRGSAVGLVERVARRLGTLGVAFYDVSARGNLLYAPGALDMNFELVWVDERGEVEIATQQRGSFGDARLSPDGTRVALTLSRGSVFGDIFVIDLESDTSVSLTTIGASMAPSWSSDGEIVAFSADPEGGSDFSPHARAADAGGQVEMLVAHEGEDVHVLGYGRDDKELVVYRRTAEVEGEMRLHRDILLADLDTGELTPLVADEFNERSGNLSPDLRWLAFVTDRTGEDQVFVTPFPDAGAL